MQERARAKQITISTITPKQRDVKDMALNNNNIRGLVEASISAIAFGTIPLFSIPVLKEGIDSLSLLVYRFAFAGVIILLVLIGNKRSMHINRGDAFRIMFISLLYAVSAIALIEGYKYMSSGIATTLCSHIQYGRLCLWAYSLKNDSNLVPSSPSS